MQINDKRFVLIKSKTIKEGFGTTLEVLSRGCWSKSWRVGVPDLWSVATKYCLTKLFFVSHSLSDLSRRFGT